MVDFDEMNKEISSNCFKKILKVYVLWVRKVRFAFLQYASAYSSRVNETTLLFIETLAWTLNFVKSDFALNDDQGN